MLLFHQFFLMTRMFAFVRFNLDLTTRGTVHIVGISVRELAKFVDFDQLSELCEGVMPGTVTTHFRELPNLNTPSANEMWTRFLFSSLMVFGCCMESKWQLPHKHAPSQRSTRVLRNARDRKHYYSAFPFCFLFSPCAGLGAVQAMLRRCAFFRSSLLAISTHRPHPNAALEVSDCRKGEPTNAFTLSLIACPSRSGEQGMFGKNTAVRTCSHICKDVQHVKSITHTISAKKKTRESEAA